MPAMIKAFSFFGVFTTPAFLFLQQMKTANTQPVPHWTDYLRDTRDGDR